MSPLATFLLVAAIIVATAESATQAGIGGAVLLVALAIQISAQAGLFLEAEGPPGRPAESFEADEL